jgi:DNA-binding transcriptional LysR family regulator
MSVRKRSERIDWDGLRYFQAVAARGTLSGAAKLLGVEHTTVARRLDALETELGARLFLRNPRGYVLTRVGETLLESANAIGVHVDRVLLLARGRDVEMRGVVRIATADALATHNVVPALPALLRAHPQLVVEIVSDARQHDLARREADLALRMGRSSDDRLVGRKLGGVGFGLYAARGTGETVDVRGAPYVWFDDTVGRLPHDDWLSEHAPEAKIVFRANRQQTLLEAVRRGLGLGILPCLIADPDRALVRVRGPKEVFTRDLSLLVHADVQPSRPVRAVIDALAAYVTTEARAIAGSRSPRQRG